MEELKSNNARLITDNECWNEILKTCWQDIVLQHGRESSNYLCNKLIDDKYSINDLVTLKNFIAERRESLKNTIKSYVKNSSRDERKTFKLSEDELECFSAHIVGMGKSFYDFIYLNPDVAFSLQNKQMENFEDSFDKAICEANLNK